MFFYIDATIYIYIYISYNFLTDFNMVYYYFYITNLLNYTFNFGVQNLIKYFYVDIPIKNNS